MSNGKQFGVYLTPSFVPTTHAAAAPSVFASAGHGVAVAMPWIAGAAAAAGAVFVTRAALQAVGALHEAEERAMAEVLANQSESAAWHRTFADVLSCHSRIERLSVTAAGLAGADRVRVPAPLDFAGQPRSEVERWCRDADAELTRVERLVADRRVRALIESAEITPIGEVLRERMRERLQDVSFANDPRVRLPDRPAPYRPSGPPPGPAPRPPAQPVTGPPTEDPVTAVQTVLDAGPVPAGEYAALLDKAEAVRAATDDPSRRRAQKALYLWAQELRKRQDRRAADAVRAADLLAGLTANAAVARSVDDGVPPLPDEHGAMLAELREVVAGERLLDAALLADARDMLRLAQRTAEDHAIATIFAEELAALGYDVAQQPGEAGRAPGLRVTHRDWNADHRAELVTAGGRLVARFRAAENTATRPDVDRSIWAEDVRAARANVAARHVDCGPLHIDGEAPEPVRRGGRPGYRPETDDDVIAHRERQRP